MTTFPSSIPPYHVYTRIFGPELSLSSYSCYPSVPFVAFMAVIHLYRITRHTDYIAIYRFIMCTAPAQETQVIKIKLRMYNSGTEKATGDDLSPKLLRRSGSVREFEILELGDIEDRLVRRRRRGDKLAAVADGAEAASVAV